MYNKQYHKDSKEKERCATQAAGKGSWPRLLIQKGFSEKEIFEVISEDVISIN